MSLGRPRLQLQGNIKIDFKELEWAITQWIYLAQDSVPEG
jgi:hypothetical protein